MSDYGFIDDTGNHHTNEEHPYGMDPRMLNFGDGNPFATSETSTSVMDTDTLDSDQNQPNGQGSEELDEEEEDGEFCICRKGSYGSMINCEACEEWFHGKCIGIDKNMADRLPHFVCHNCNNATLAENLEIHTASLISNKRSRQGSDKAETSEDISEVRSGSKRKAKEIAETILAKKSSNVKKAGNSKASAAVQSTSSPNTKVYSKKAGQESDSGASAKKRSRMDPEADVSVAKKPKLKENDSSVTHSEEKHRMSTSTTTQAKKEEKKLTPTSSSSHRLASSTVKPLERHRAGFRKSLFSVIEAALNGPEYEQAEIEALSMASSSSKVTPAEPSESDINGICSAIEEVWYEKCGRDSESDAYTESLRSLRFSLKQNPTLIARLVHGTLDATTLSLMTAEEMAPAKARAALQELRQEDEMARSRVADKEGEFKLESDMFKIRGRTDDRIIGTLPTFAPIQDDDDTALLGSITPSGRTDLLSSALSSSGTPRNAAVLGSSTSSLTSSSMDVSGPSGTPSGSKVSESDLVSSTDTLIPTVMTDPSLLAASKKVDIDLDAFDVPQLKLATPLVSEETLVNNQPSSTSKPAQAPAPRRGDSELQSGIRSILDEIAFDSGDKRVPPYDPSASGGYDPFDNDNSHESGSSSSNYRPSSAAPSHSSKHRGSALGDSGSSLGSIGSNIWHGAITYPGQCPEVQVVLNSINGPSIDKVLHKIPVLTFDVVNQHDLKSIMDYLPQLERSSSRSRSLLFFEPIDGNAESERNYRELFQLLYSGSKTGIVNVKGAIAADGTLKEIYILPIKAGDDTYAAVIPPNVSSSSRDRLYLSVISDKRRIEKVNSETSTPTPTSTPPMSSLGGPAALGGPLGSSRVSPSSVLGAPSSVLGGAFPSVLGGGLGGPTAHTPLPPVSSLGGRISNILTGPIPNLPSPSNVPMGPYQPAPGSGQIPSSGPGMSSVPLSGPHMPPSNQIPPMKGPPAGYRGPPPNQGPPPGYGHPNQPPRYDPYGPPLQGYDAPGPRDPYGPPLGGRGGAGGPPSHMAHMPPYGRGPPPQGYGMPPHGHKMPPASSSNSYPPPQHHQRGPPPAQFHSSGSHLPPNVPSLPYPPAGPPSNPSASVQATSFLDSLMGVDLTNLLGPGNKGPAAP